MPRLSPEQVEEMRRLVREIYPNNEAIQRAAYITGYLDGWDQPRLPMDAKVWPEERELAQQRAHRFAKLHYPNPET